VTRIVRGRLLSFRDSPRRSGADAHRYIADGAVLLDGGKIVEVGEYREIATRAQADAVVDDHSGKLVLPGFIDAHIHYPQTRVVGSYGAQLLEWLQKYTFVEEQKFSDPAHATAVAKFFLDELARNGTTTAMVYCTVRPESAEAFFAEAERRNVRMIAGKVMMDRNAPAALTDDPQRGYDESKALLLKWHGRSRLSYAITPRFAITSTPSQLEAAGALAREFPDAYIQTHLSENDAEIVLTKSLFPGARDYLDVYEQVGLVGPKSVFGHCLHLEPREIASLADHRSVAAFCPTSNLFLGSGLFDEAGLDAAGVRVALATDIGGGTSYSMLVTANEAYKVLQLRRQSWPALQAFYQLTLGNARALGLDDRIGALETGFEADLVVLNSCATPAMMHRMETPGLELAEELFVLMTMGDDRAIVETYVSGAPTKNESADLRACGL
jgi:guanine deaminase